MLTAVKYDILGPSEESRIAETDKRSSLQSCGLGSIVLQDFNGDALGVDRLLSYWTRTR